MTEPQFYFFVDILGDCVLFSRCFNSCLLTGLDLIFHILIIMVRGLCLLLSFMLQWFVFVRMFARWQIVAVGI